jgi:nucleoside-diphosphate-sugar epimerase
MSVLLCIGLGYSAAAVAARLKSAEWRIIGTARSEESAAAIRDLGYEAALFADDGPSGDVSAAVAEATHLLISAPPDETGDPVLNQLGDDLARAEKLCWIGYLSTVGVYGDHDGGWVDEDTPLQPGNARNVRRAAAEEAWQRFASERGLPLQIFRLAGIYGPGRSPVDGLKMLKVRYVDKPGQVFNRIHVEDIASTVVAGIHAGTEARGIFNVADDEPAPPQEVGIFAAELLRAPPPEIVPWEKAELSPMSMSFYEANRRVSNRRIKEVLGVTLTYPTYREGLRALVAEKA